MKKIIALLLALCVSSSLIQTTLAADTATLEISDIKLINKKSTDELESVEQEAQFTSVLTLDPNDGSHMIYMDNNYATGYTFATKNFFRNENKQHLAIAWPPKLKDDSYRTGLPNQQAVIDNENNTLYSSRTGITYKLPARNASGSTEVTGTESALIDCNGWNGGYGSRPATDILVYDKVDRIYFLLATGCNNSDKVKTGSVGVYVNYDDGTSTFPPQWTHSSTYGSYYNHSFNGQANKSEAMGQNGYLCIKLPDSTKGQTDEHFVADFDTYCNPTETGSAKYTGNFVKNVSPDTTVAAYEYYIDVDENKTITDIVFASAYDGLSRTGVAILGMAYEYSEDVGIKGQVDSLNDSLSYTAAIGDSATLDQIIDATNKMIELKDYKEYINFNEKTGFFSDNAREITTINKDSLFDVTFTATNPTGAEAKMHLITALYDENETLVDAIPTEVIIPEYQRKAKISKEVEIPNKDFSYARFYIWNNEITPYGDRAFYAENEYTQVDLTDYANGKFYANADRVATQYTAQNPVELKSSTYNNYVNFNALTDFAGVIGGSYSKTAAYYPLQTKADKTKILDPYDGLYHSTSGVKYAMPQKREGVHNKEVVTISNYDVNSTATIALEPDIYEKIHFIVSSSNEVETKLRAIVNFADKSTKVEYFDICKYTETTNEFCIENLYNASSLSDGAFLKKPANEAVNLLMLEFSIDINNPKVVESITFELIEKDRLEVVPNNAIGNVVLTAITTERKNYSSVKTNLEARINGEYSDEEAKALREIANFLESKGIDCSDLDIPSTNKARQIFISANANTSIADGTKEKPFATVDAACEYIRSNTSYIGDWEVLFREGSYVVTETIKISEELLPNVSSVTFKPYNNEDVEFTGSKKIDISKKQSVPDTIKTRLPSSSADKVVQIDLTAQGITNVSPYGIYKYDETRSPASRIIIDKKAYNVARWPNEGAAEAAASFAAITYPTSSLIGNQYKFKFYSSSSNAKKWNGNAKDAIIYGFFKTSNDDWYSDSFRLGNCSVSGSGSYQTATVTTDFVVNYDNQNKRFFIENLLEEIDEEGEWYIDPDTNILYIYPVDGAENYSITTLTDSIFTVSNISNIHFEDLLFNGGVGGAVSFVKTNNCEIKNCDIRNFTSYPIYLEYCKNSGVMSCDMSMLGTGAVHIKEQDTKYNQRTFTSRNAYVIDCKIENFSTYSRRGSAINLYNTIGTEIKNNKISNSPTTAISGHTINSLIKYNDISYVQKDYGDAGALYFCQSYITQGNEISNNYIHDLIPYGSVDRQVGIYMDDLGSGYDIKNNVIKNVHIGIQLGGGKNLNVTNNLIHSNSYTIWADNRGIVWDDNESGASKRRTELIEQLKQNPLYRLEFPHTMSNLYLGDDYYNHPTNNTIKNNSYYNTTVRFLNGTAIWEDSDHNNNVSNNSNKSSDIITDAQNNSAIEFSKIGLLTRKDQ